MEPYPQRAYILGEKNGNLNRNEDREKGLLEMRKYCEEVLGWAGCLSWLGWVHRSFWRHYTGVRCGKWEEKRAEME